MAKGIAVHALVVVALIAMLLFFALIIFWKWIGSQNMETTKAACAIKYSNCCLQLKQDKPCDWANVPPKECETVQITEPADKDSCII
jgi:hypothetical protein